MIPKETIDLIVETARIDEVVGDFIPLKKRGVNLLGHCPFHTEKTPSFTVSPTKGIYKCFGCGKAGDSIKFVMEHESYSYPEALRYLADKYRIQIEEEKPTVEQLQKQDEKESLYVMYSFAQKYYTDTAFFTEEGKAIGLSYFNERGFNEHIIKKFQLGYALNQWDGLAVELYKNDFNKDLIEKSGLVVVKDTAHESGSEVSPSHRMYDRFRSRVIFPVHNLSGRVIAFGARILHADPKSPKYINSPETEIYSKSKSLYGIFFARKSIIQHDECFLVEGYTDVISLHQAGVENVVASSGTSLTTEQIKLISRFTKNVTILYDGDAAGIKASLRGIDLILEEGLNVRIVLFPDGDDPDSFARKTGTLQLKEYIGNHAKDFISFKTDLLLAEAANDPIKKAGLIRDIVESISKIPDGIIRSMYIKNCAEQMLMSEQVLLVEMNKLRKSVFRKREGEQIDHVLEQLIVDAPDAEQPVQEEGNSIHQEKEIIRLLLNYGDREFPFFAEDNQKLTVKEFILNEILPEGFGFDNEVYAGIFTHFVSLSAKEYLNMINTDMSPSLDAVRNHSLELIMTKYELSDWEAKGVFVKTEEINFKEAIVNPIYHLKLRRAQMLKRQNSLLLRTKEDLADDELNEILEKQKMFQSFIYELSKHLGIVTLE
jgi:DNA primase